MQGNLDDLKIEELFTLAEDISKRLEAGEESLEDSIASYEQGMKVVAALNERLDSAEKQIKIIYSNSNGEIDE